MSNTHIKTLKPFENSVDLNIIKDFFQQKGRKTVFTRQNSRTNRIVYLQNSYRVDKDAYTLLENKYLQKSFK